MRVWMNVFVQIFSRETDGTLLSAYTHAYLSVSCSPQHVHSNGDVRHATEHRRTHPYVIVPDNIYAAAGSARARRLLSITLIVLELCVCMCIQM